MGMLGEGNLMWDFDEDCCIAAKLTSSFARKMANLQWQPLRKVCMRIEICASCDLEV